MTGLKISRRGWLLILAAAALVWFSNIEYRKLIHPDEGRYAEIPREMVASGDWVTPRLDGLKYFEKPALQYWATAVAYEVFGEHHWTARLWTALTGLLGIAAVVFCGWHLFGRDAGNYAGMVLGSALLYVGAAHFDSLDMGVTAFMTVTLCAFLMAQRDGAEAGPSRNWMWLAWAAAALAFLSKGLQAIVLPGTVLVLYTLIERDFALWKKLHFTSGLAIFCVISAPWLIWVSIANPEFPYFFFIHEHFQRFLTKTHGRFQPWWWFVPILLAGVVPWTLLMFEGVVSAWQRQPDKHFQPQRFLLMWAVFIFVFFSVSDSKLPPYILPIFPALALLLGARLTQLSPMRFRAEVAPMLLVAAIGFGAGVMNERFASAEVPAALYQNFSLWIYAASALLAAATVAALLADRRGHRELAVILLAAGGLGFVQLIGSGHDSLAPANSSYYLVQAAQPELALEDPPGQPRIPFYSVGFYDQTLPFYLKRTVTLVNFEGELDFGINLEKMKYIPTIQEFETRWRADDKALAIMQPDRYRELAAAALPMRLLAQDTRRVLVAKPQSGPSAPPPAVRP
jgi:4-amino-4-deoxy-L-arabinose transferase-like glycosyltransferase